MINFEFSRIRFEFTALTSFKQPYFLGSSIRGVLGRRLKKIVCIKPFKECVECDINKTCPYTVVFETESFLNQPSKYVFQPEYSTKELKEGDKIFVDITLLGWSSNFWPFIIEALNTVINLGKDRFIKRSDVYYYHPFEDKYYRLKDATVPRFNASGFFDLKTGRNSLKVRLFPTSLKAENRYVRFDEFNKDIFLRAIVNRVSNVAINYGQKEGKIFIDKNSFEIENLNLKPSPMTRWSNRKKRKMLIPAFEGEFEIVGDLSQIYPYINIIENINLGKSVSFGLGVVKVS